ncbi:MAG: hypothetical protein MHM6MM_001993 [Cercozoa sp. M6MM]
MATMTGHTVPVRGCWTIPSVDALDPWSNFLVSLDSRGWLRTWDLSTGNCIRAAQLSIVNGSDSESLSTSGSKKGLGSVFGGVLSKTTTVRFMSLGTGVLQVHTCDESSTKETFDAVGGVALLMSTQPASHLIATAPKNSREVRIFNLADGALEHVVSLAAWARIQDLQFCDHRDDRPDLLWIVLLGGVLLECNAAAGEIVRRLDLRLRPNAAVKLRIPADTMQHVRFDPVGERLFAYGSSSSLLISIAASGGGDLSHARYAPPNISPPAPENDSNIGKDDVSRIWALRMEDVNEPIVDCLLDPKDGVCIAILSSSLVFYDSHTRPLDFTAVKLSLKASLK